MTLLHQEVELKYHQLCQGDQEAAESEDHNNQGGLQSAVCRANGSGELSGTPLVFQTGFSDEELPVGRFLWVLYGVTLTSFRQVRHVW